MNLLLRTSTTIVIVTASHKGMNRLPFYECFFFFLLFLFVVDYN